MKSSNVPLAKANQRRSDAATDTRLHILHSSFRQTPAQIRHYSGLSCTTSEAIRSIDKLRD
jgi:hypothetical protein